ncbi:MAG: hypothetical protein HY907_20045 [Deltaproteobacteria bacterium]|nr:hypothetical protein [Deltaproteobacteria bacterium]
MARSTRILLPAILLACAPGLPACGGESSPSGQPRSCGSATCGGVGTCFEEGGFAWCACPDGTHPDGLTCVADNAAVPCDGVLCGGHGWCRVGAGGRPACDCFEGYHPATGGNLVCLADAADDGGPDVEGDAVDADAGEGLDVDGEGDAAAEGEGEVSADGDGDPDADAADDAEAETDSGCTGELGGPCHLSRQCGCADGERCIVATGSGGFVEQCAPAGSAVVGAPCTMMMDDCVRGSQCLPPFGQFSCQRFCTSSTDCPATACLGGWFAGTLYGFCEPTASACVPVTNFGCPAGGACRVISAPALRTYCGTAGPGGDGADCLVDGCQGGYACHLIDLANIRCLRYCLLSAPECTTGTCTDVYGNGSVGLCLP